MTTIMRAIMDRDVDDAVHAAAGNLAIPVRRMLKRFKRSGDQIIEITATAAALAAAGTVPIFVPENATQRVKVRDAMLIAGGTNFATGDRTIVISDGTTTFGTIAAALAQALATTRWGGTNFTFGSGAAPNTAHVAGQNLRLAYAGGTSDYATGSLVIVVAYELVVE